MKKNNLLLVSILLIGHLHAQFGCLTTYTVDSETGTITSRPVHYAGCSCPCAHRTNEGTCLECGHKANMSTAYTDNSSISDKKLSQMIKEIFKKIIKN